MKNVVTKIVDNILTITVDLSKTYGLSPSGKSNIVATTGGNMHLAGNDNFRIGVNVYGRLKEKEAI